MILYIDFIIAMFISLLIHQMVVIAIVWYKVRVFTFEMFSPREIFFERFRATVDATQDMKIRIIAVAPSYVI